MTICDGRLIIGTMTRISLALMVAACVLLAGCAGNPRNASEREWQMAECQRILDEKMRERCVERVESEYGRR